MNRQQQQQQQQATNCCKLRPMWQAAVAAGTGKGIARERRKRGKAGCGTGCGGIIINHLFALQMQQQFDKCSTRIVSVCAACAARVRVCVCVACYACAHWNFRLSCQRAARRSKVCYSFSPISVFFISLLLARLMLYFPVPLFLSFTRLPLTLCKKRKLFIIIQKICS